MASPDTVSSACEICGNDGEPDPNTLHNGELLCIHCAQGCTEDCVHITLLDD